MKWQSNHGKIPGDRAGGVRFEETAQDPELKTVLEDFRASVHAWSDEAYRSRASVLSSVPHRTLWHRSLVWALSLVLTAGVALAGVYQYHQKELARQAALQHDRTLQHEAQVNEVAHETGVASRTQQQTRDADELLARVDSDVARETPSAMEPLASLMDDDEKQ